MFRIKVSDNKVSILGFENNRVRLGDLVIPNEINGMEVVSIADYAFKNNQFNSISFPNTLERIGCGAFQNAYIGSVDLSMCINLKYIGLSAFKNCRISDLKLPITEHKLLLEHLVFSKNKISKLDLSDKNVILSHNCFSFNEISDLKLSADIETIPSNCFMNNLISHLDISNLSNLKVIDMSAFAYNPIVYVNFPLGINISVYPNVFSNELGKPLTPSTFRNSTNVKIYQSNTIGIYNDVFYFDNKMYDIIQNKTYEFVNILRIRDMEGVEHYAIGFDDIYAIGDSLRRCYIRLVNSRRYNIIRKQIKKHLQDFNEMTLNDFVILTKGFDMAYRNGLLHNLYLDTYYDRDVFIDNLLDKDSICIGY